MADSFQQKIDKNINSIIEQGLQLEGPLKDSFIKITNDTRATLEAANRAKEARHLATLTPEQIDAQVEVELQKSAAQYKNALTNAAKGNSNAASVDIDGIKGLASAGSAIGSGGILDMIGALMSLASNSIVGKYIKAAINMFAGDPKPKSFTESLAQVSFSDGIDSLSKDLGVDPRTLKASLLADTPAADAAPSPAPASPPQPAPAPQPQVSAKLTAAVQEYAKVRFNTKDVTKGKAKEFVDRYMTSVAPRMSVQEQENRATDIISKTALIKSKIAEAGEDAGVVLNGVSSPDKKTEKSDAMRKALDQAIGLMKEVDQPVKAAGGQDVPPALAGLLPAQGKLPDAKAVKDFATKFKEGQEQSR